MLLVLRAGARKSPFVAFFSLSLRKLVDSYIEAEALKLECAVKAADVAEQYARDCARAAAALEGQKSKSP